MKTAEIAAPTAHTVSIVRTGPSFAAALVGFLSTTVATTVLVVLIGTVA